MVSVRGVFRTIHDILYFCYLAEGRDKLRVFTSFLPNLFPRTLRGKYSILPRISERLKSGIVRGITLRTWGFRFLVVDREGVRIVSPLFESWMWNFLKPKRGDVFLDVGAHVGKYTCIVAKMVGGKGKVIALEPHPTNYYLLTKNICANKLDNVIALNVAAWNENSELKLYSGSTSGRHSVKYVRDGGYITVKARRIDDILEELNIDRVDWVKIDAEGAEYEVLQGMERTLRKCRCKLILECRRENLGKVISFLNILGYRAKIVKESGIPYLFCYPL